MSEPMRNNRRQAHTLKLW